MSLENSIAFLGAGQMAEAMIRGLLHAGAYSAERIVASDPRAPRLEELRARHGILTTPDNAAAMRGAAVVVLAVKPQAFDRVLPEVGAHLDDETLCISIAAGVPLAVIEGALPAHARVVRAMPNTPAIAREGATALSAGQRATSGDVERARQIFESVGRVVVVDESLLDAVTGLSGSGPAYVFVVIEALADAGVKVGLHRSDALLLAAQTVLGSARLVLETGEHPGRLKDMVTSPGGTAICGLHTLESGGLRKTLIDAVESATLRAGEIGRIMAAKLAR